MIVYTVFVELPLGDEVGYLHGVYATEALAQHAADREYDDRIGRGEMPWFPRHAQPGECNEDWDFDIHVHADQVIEAQP